MPIDITGSRTGSYILRNVSNDTFNLSSSGMITSFKGGSISGSYVNNFTFNLDGSLRIVDLYARNYGVDVFGNGNTFNLGVGFNFDVDHREYETGALKVSGTDNFINNYSQLDGWEDIIVTSAGNTLANYGTLWKLTIPNQINIYNEGTLGLVVAGNDYDRTDASTVIVNKGDWRGFSDNPFQVGNAFEGSSSEELIVNQSFISANVLLGAGNDTFANDGGYMGGVVYGGLGDDTFIYDRGEVRGVAGPLPGSFQVVELVDEGVDTLVLTAEYLQDQTASVILFNNVENLILEGNSAKDARGNSLNNVMVGNDGSNFFEGSEGDDTLVGAKGSDRLDGGNGVDTAVFAGDRANFRYTKNTDGSVTVTGLNGSSVEGIDTLMRVEKLQFNDIIIDLDAIVEKPLSITSNGGGDTASIKIAEGKTAVTTVQAESGEPSITYSLTNNGDGGLFSINSKTGALSFKNAADFEAPKDVGRDNVYNVTVKAMDGTSSDTQTILVSVTNVSGSTINGTSRDDTLKGGNENDTIRGNGGADALAGGLGNDVIYGGEGKDVLNGGTGDDRLFGGLQADVLTGGIGKDTFVFDSKLGSSNVDKLTDFSVKSDTIWLDDDVFKKVGKVGDLASSAFWTGTKAHDSNDRIIYDKDTGKLWYDEDGNGSSSAVQIAQMNKKLALSMHDFDIIA